MNRIHFSVLGNPKAQKHYRYWQRGKAKGTYDPSASDKADFLAMCRDNAPEKSIEGGVILRLVFWMPIPSGKSKKFRLDVEDYELTYERYSRFQDEIVRGRFLAESIPRGVAHIKARFDVDNNLIFVMNALAGVYWKNDGQVQIGWAYKIYSHKPRTELEIIY